MLKTWMKSSVLLWIWFAAFLLWSGSSLPLSQAVDEGNRASPSQESDWENEVNRNRDQTLPREEQQREPCFGGIITVQRYADPSTLNNLTRTDGSAESISVLIAPRLLDLDPDTVELIPFTAAALPRLSEDKKVHTWQLRAGLKWDDFETSGAYVTTKDIRLSFELMKDPAARCPTLSDFEDLVDIKVLDEYTFQAVYDHPIADAVYRMGYKFRIIPSHLLADVPPPEIESHALGRNPVGFGLFRFRHWKQNDEIVLVRNDMNRDLFPERYRPYVDGIRMRTVSNQDLIHKLFLRGEIDLIGMDADTWKYETVKDRFTEVGTRHFYLRPGGISSPGTIDRSFSTMRVSVAP
ncbi:MAG: hypothetical protein KJ645_03625 [Planctomycetes bacterium]|nr:hypothetical protein [Planctomycetota bacterium]